MPDSREHPSTASVFGDALAKAAHLFGSQVQLVRLEVGEKIATAIQAIVGIVIAAVFLIVAMIFLLQGVVALLVERGWTSPVANFGVGAGIAILALIAIVVASRSLSPARMRLDRSIHQLHADAAIVKDSAR